MSQLQPPFTCTHSPNLPELLSELKVSLALTTYQAGKVIFLSPTPEDGLVQLLRSFPSPMGLGLHQDRLALATKDQLLVFANNTEMAASYPPKPGVYDALYLPRAAWFTGQLALHDLAWAGGGWLAVNTACSCLSRVSERFSAEVLWQPPFISAIEPDDRCHLNGMAVEDGEARFVTCLADTDEPGGWRKDLDRGRGLLMHVPSGEPVLREVYFPHSPRLHRGKLYLVESGTGELLEVDPQRGTRRSICRLDGFARGMALIGDFMFVGLSKIRQKSSTFKDLPISKRSLMAGVAVLDLRTGTQVAFLKYENAVEEIYDVQLLTGMGRPNILTPGYEDRPSDLVLSGATFWGEHKKQG